MNKKYTLLFIKMERMLCVESMRNIIWENRYGLVIYVAYCREV